MTATVANPLLEPWTGRFGEAPFADVRPEHFLPAIEALMAEQRRAIDAIAANPAEPDFANTIVALEKSGLRLDQVVSVFFNLTGANTNDALEAIERDVAPVLARHGNEISLNEPLFRRIEALWQQARARSGSTPSSSACSTATTRIFVRAGARLDAAGKKRLAAINERLATLGTLFSQNVLADEKAYMLVLDGEDDLAGLPDWLPRGGGAGGGRSRPSRQARHHPVALVHRAVPAILGAARPPREGLRGVDPARRERRRDRQPGDDGRDGRAPRRARAAPRLRRATPTSASPTRWRRPRRRRSTSSQACGRRAQARGGGEAGDLQALIAEEGGNFAPRRLGLAHYAEKMRKRRFDFDGGELKPYLQLEKMIEAAFDTASRLFGLTFTELHDVPVYHPDVRVWKVSTATAKPRRPLPRRLLRAALEAERRLDERASRPAAARPATSGRSSST